MCGLDVQEHPPVLTAANGKQGGRCRQHLKVVAAQHNANNIFPNVVHVAFDSSHDDDARIVISAASARIVLGLLNERKQVSHRLLHDTRTFDDLERVHNTQSLCCSPSMLQDSYNISMVGCVKTAGR